MKIISSLLFLSEKQQQKRILNIKNSITDIIKLIIPANNATITPPLGPMLGQFGINIIEFCNEFNKETEDYLKDTPLIIEIYLYSNKSFFFDIKGPVFSVLLTDIFALEINENKEILFDDFLKSCYDLLILKFLINNKIKNITTQEISINSSIYRNFLIELIGTARSLGLNIK